MALEITGDTKCEMTLVLFIHAFTKKIFKVIYLKP